MASLYFDPWPEHKCITNELKQRNWVIFFKKDLSSQLSLESLSNEISANVIAFLSKYFASQYSWTELNENDFKVFLEYKNSKKISVTIETGRYANSDPFIVFAPLWALVNIERKIGTIDRFEIDGKIYNKWEPWVNRKIFLGELV